MSYDQDVRMLAQRLQAIENGTHPAIRALLERANGAAARARQIETLYEETKRHNEQMTTLLQKVNIGGPMAPLMADADRVQYIEQIPGRRVPFDLLAEVPIDEESTMAVQKSLPISNFGPFIARARVISFLSLYRYSVLDPETAISAQFSGRSFGRFRSPHSASDIMDGHLPPVQQFVGAAPGTGAALWASPVVHSPYRTMQPDARIWVSSESDGFPRQNMPVPSAFWTTNINAPFALPALDFFDRNESIAVQVTPLHVNNPMAGNLTNLPGVAPYPFLGQQYDHHEGVVDPVVAEATVDPVTRLPRGMWILGYSGYRILQAPGALGGIA